MLVGKSNYIWEISAILGGNVDKIADALQAGGYQTAILHSTAVANWRTSARVALVKALKARGISPILGAAVYGADPVGEGKGAAALCVELGLEGAAFDAETAFDAQTGSATNAKKLLQAFKAGTPNCWAGWCWWSFHHSSDGKVQYHPVAVLQAAMALADVGMPMAYWSWGDAAADAEAYLVEAVRQWRSVTDKPIAPIGRAYTGDGGHALPEAVFAFERKARSLCAPGVSWWSMQHALALPSVWDALSALEPFGQPDDPNPDATHYVAQVDGQRVRCAPGTGSAPVSGYLLHAGQALTGLLEVAVLSANDVWARFESLGGNWCALVNGDRVYIRRA